MMILRWRRSGFVDLALEMAMLMVVDQLAQRVLIHRSEHVRELLFRLSCRGERGSINLAQRTHERVAVFAADLAVLVAVTSLQPWLIHFRLLSVIASAH